MYSSLQSFCGTGCSGVWDALTGPQVAAYPGLSASDFRNCYCSSAYDPGRHAAGDFSNSVCHSECQAFREAEFATTIAPNLPAVSAAEFFTCTCSPNYDADPNMQVISLCAPQCQTLFSRSFGHQYTTLLPNTTCVGSQQVTQCACSDPVNVWPQMMMGAFTALSNVTACGTFIQGLSCTEAPPPSATPPNAPPALGSSANSSAGSSAGSGTLELHGTAPSIIFGGAGMPQCTLALNGGQLETTCALNAPPLAGPAQRRLGREGVPAEATISRQQYDELRAEVAQLRRTIEEITKSKARALPKAWPNVK